MKTLHIINSTVTGGGAQEMLRKLVTNAGSGSGQRVISLSQPEGAILGLEPDHYLGISTASGVPAAILRLRQLIRAEAPDVICAWMYASCVLATLARPRGVPLVWNIRHSVPDIMHEKLSTRVAIRACSALSSLPEGTIYCAETTVPQHQALGFRDRSSLVIPNGFELDRFTPIDPLKRRDVREAFGLPVDAVLLGNAGRWHPMKNHTGLLDAFAQLTRARDDLHLVLAGIEIDSKNLELLDMINTRDLSGRVSLIGLQTDMPRFFSMLDIYLQTSLWGEAFPNVLGEAMACGTPAVTTDVGDSAQIVGNTGCVVRQASADALATGVLDILQRLEHEGEACRQAARTRIEARYSMPTIITRYAQVMGDIARG